MILTVDSSTKAASVALIDDGKIIYSSFLNDGKTHSQKLMPMVEECLEKANIKARDIDVFAAIVGPGSFTGLRIGIGAIQGLAYTTGKQCIAISTLDALAYNIPHFDGLVVPMIDARNAQAYSAIYDGGDSLMKIADDMAKPVAEIAEDVRAYNRKAVFLGCGAKINRDIIVNILGDKALFAPEQLNYQLASTASVIAQTKYSCGETVSADKLLPYYFRDTSAKKKFKK